MKLKEIAHARTGDKGEISNISVIPYDEIIGFMHLREAMTCYLKNNYRNVPVKELHSYIRPVDFIPESKNIDRLFKEMQAKKNHIVIVMDEYGQTSGLVTLEDILEEIVGNNCKRSA